MVSFSGCLAPGVDYPLGGVRGTRSGPDRRRTLRAVSTGDYKFPAAVITDVLSDRQTEIWAQAYYSNVAPTPMPIIAVLHGNHGTCGTGSSPRQDSSCQYTTSGTCPAGFVVTPNHLGYAYFAERLASWGYFVISINANRGITCGSGVSGDSGLNLARGRLILKHLEKLSLWATGQEAPPASLGMNPLNQLDFSKVGMAGHSRGGEGIRAAYAQYLDVGSTWPGKIKAPVDFIGLFEIGAVDGQTSRVLNAKGVPWNQLLPMCDGDVSDLQGLKPYDRMADDFDELPVAPKSTYAVWGANHNFYNTEWQESDSSGCSGHTPLFPPTIGSPQQRTTGLAAVMAFFRTHLAPGGLDTDLIDNFDSLSELPAVVSDITKVDRNFLLSPNSDTSPLLEDFTGPTGKSKFGFNNLAIGVTVSHGTVPEHDPSYRGGKLSWTKAGRFTLFQNVWAARGDGIDLSGYDTFDLQVSRSTSSLNPAAQTPTDFSLVLLDGNGAKSAPLSLSTYTSLLGPVGSTTRLHQILKTVRIPLADFQGIDKTRVRSLRIVFDKTTKGEIYLSGIRASRFTESMVTASGGSALQGLLAPAAVAAEIGGAATVARVSLTGSVRSIQQSAAAPALDGAAGVEIELSLDAGALFPVRDALAVLEVGSERFTISRHPDGDTSRLIFTIPVQDFAKLRAGAPIRVYYGDVSSDASNWEASFGNLN